MKFIKDLRYSDIALFLLQHRSHYSAALQTLVTSMSPPPRRANDGNGNRQCKNKGLPKRSHAAPSPLKQTSGAVWFLRSQTGDSRTRQMCFPHTGPTSPFPLTLTPHHRGPPDSPGQRLTQQPHIRHGSSPPCQCWMVNQHKTSLLECVTEFRQWQTRKAWN